MNVLITGGAGFIGIQLARKLINQGFNVRLIDNFHSQIHSSTSLPKSLFDKVEIIKSDIRNRKTLRECLTGINIIIHLAAETGTGQSMYEIDRYFSVNSQGTAVLLDLLQNDPCGKNVKSIVVASSRAIYGEGAYLCSHHGEVYPEQRSKEQMTKGFFEPICPLCSTSLTLIPTTEQAPFKPMSIYGLTKQVQEQAVLMFAKTNGINGFALRYQNVYGPGQSLKNPYTGILAVFSNLARQDQPIEIYEDGQESRDFVYIDDVVEATVRSINYQGQFVGALNVGSGHATSVMTVAQEIKNFFNSNSSIGVTGAFRLGDIRHNIADTNLLNEVLGFIPSTSFKQGLNNFLSWALEQSPEDKAAYLRSVNELAEKGLMGKVSK